MAVCQVCEKRFQPDSALPVAQGDQSWLRYCSPACEETARDRRNAFCAGVAPQSGQECPPEAGNTASLASPGLRPCLTRQILHLAVTGLRLCVAWVLLQLGWALLRLSAMVFPRERS